MELEVLVEGVLDGGSHSFAGQMHPTWLVDRDQRFVQSITRYSSNAVGIGMIDCFDIASEQKFEFESVVLCING
ncbi:MAG: hypothetical protein CL915_08335 [Deltaproteobacteria bacterium]|nr:hypothetical protein [Deltaproteobacteria bacterium]